MEFERVSTTGDDAPQTSDELIEKLRPLMGETADKIAVHVDEVLDEMRMGAPVLGADNDRNYSDKFRFFLINVEAAMFGNMRNTIMFAQQIEQLSQQVHMLSNIVMQHQAALGIKEPMQTAPTSGEIN